MDVIHLIGCGNVGFLVAQLIPTLETVKELYLYDGGNVEPSDWVKGIYPKKYCEELLPKVKATYLEIIKGSFDGQLHIINSYIKDTSGMIGLKIDCTDTKSVSKLDVDFRVSYDDGIITLDSRKGIFPHRDVDYLNRGTVESFKIVAQAVIQYIKKEEYKHMEMKIGQIDLTKGSVRYGHRITTSTPKSSLFGYDKIVEILGAETISFDLSEG